MLVNSRRNAVLALLLLSLAAWLPPVHAATPCAVTTAAPTYLNNTTGNLSCDLAGGLRITGTLTPSGTTDENLKQVNGATVNVGPGASSTGTQRVTTSTDSTIGTVTTITNPVTTTSTSAAPVAPAAATATTSMLLGCQAASGAVTFTNGQQGYIPCSLTGALFVGGGVAAQTTDAGNPVKVGGVFGSTTGQTLTAGQRGDMQLDAHGSQKSLLVDGNGNTVDLTLPAGVQFVPTAATANAFAGSASTAAATNLVLKASAGNLYGAYLVNDTASKIYFMVFNATALPSNGAVTPRHCVAVAANTTGSIDFGGQPMESYGTGMTLGSSSTGCFTLTATNASFLYGRVQ